MHRISFGARERAADVGVSCLADAELLALVLGTGNRGEPVGVLAQSVLEELGGVEGIARAGIGELTSARGLGPARGARVAAATELGRRAFAASSRKDGASMSDPSTVDAWARPRLVTLDHEELWALALDGRNRLRAARRIAAGGLHGMHVLPRDVLRAMVREAASAFVLVHNHPSGDCRPSEEDVGFTLRVVEAARALATPLVDHLVLGAPGYTSMLEAGILK